MTDDLVPNAELFTPEFLARHTIERFGDEAGLQDPAPDDVVRTVAMGRKDDVAGG
ncbi:MAG: hypothetical protein V4559_08905 [Pseudomonadota bacterium]